MKKFICLTGFSLLINISLNASTGSGFEFLKTHFGARAAAMGGAYVASMHDLNAIGYNPAGLTGITNKKITVSYLDGFVDFQQGMVSYGQDLDNHRIIAASVAYMNYGSIERTEEYTGKNIGSFSPSDFQVNLSYADQSELGICYGVTAKYIRSQIDQYNADAIAVDGGLLYCIENQKMNIGLSITNLGQALSAFKQVKENLPLTYRAGFSKTLAHLPLTLFFNLYRYQFQESDLVAGLYWALGGEFQLSEKTFLRWGYNSIGHEQNMNSDQDRFAGISFGFGTQIKKFVIDYALSYHGVIGSNNQFTIQFML